jgi:competence/damage-inducible protein CinA-like protein
MPSAEIITIGTEILLGEIVDTNTRFLSLKLREQGIDLYRQTTVGDNIQRIAQAIQSSLPITDVIITTGGLGPTIDDPTRLAIAAALEIETEFRADLWEQIKERHLRFGRTPTENNKRQAYVPQGAIAIENQVGTAPAFISETETCAIIALPGVPREMEHIMETTIIPYLHQRLDLNEVIQARVIHTSGAGESQIDNLIGDLEQLSNPTVGLAAHAGRVDVRITAKARTVEQAQALIEEVERQVKERLAAWIYGADQDTLEQVALMNIQSHGWKLAVLEAGLKGELIRMLAANGGTFIGGEMSTTPLSPDDLVGWMKKHPLRGRADVILGVALHPGEQRQEIYLACHTPEIERLVPLSYGGPPGYASTWAANQGLDLLRKL